MKYLLLFIALFVIVDAHTSRCGHDEYMEVQYEKDPSLRGRMEEQERLLSMTAREEVSEERQQTIYTIRTVVHIVWNTAAQNIGDGYIVDQIARLNIDYRRVDNASTTVSSFKSFESDLGIQFVLATTDPNGNPTNGITRTQTSRTSFNAPSSRDPSDACKYTALGGQDAWDTTKYMNIWVCFLNSSTLGYAQQPGGTAASDGIVISSIAFGRSGNSPFDLGRTLTHEAGHWFNLLHPWGNREGDCTEDDLVADTPAEISPAYGCQLTRVTCSNLNMVQNYMDYSDDKCMTLFTPGQTARARAALTTYRAGTVIADYTGEVIGLNGYVSPYPNPSDNGASSLMSVFYGFVCIIAIFFV